MFHNFIMFDNLILHKKSFQFIHLFIGYNSPGQIATSSSRLVHFHSGW